MDYDNMYAQNDGQYVNSNFNGYQNQMNSQAQASRFYQGQMWPGYCQYQAQQNIPSMDRSQDRIQQRINPINQDMNSQWNAQLVSNQGNQNQAIPVANTQASMNNSNANSNQYVREELITLNEAISLIKKSVGDEKEDEEFYDSLIKSAPNVKSREIITSIRNDERKHNQILRDVYFRLTGMRLPPSNQTSNTNNTTSNNLNQKNVNTLNSSKSVVSNSSTSNNSKSTTDNTMLNSTNSYKNNLVKALFGETEAVAKYRRIMGAMNDNATYTLLMSIMTDEIRHAAKYNYLIATA